MFSRSAFSRSPFSHPFLGAFSPAAPTHTGSAAETIAAFVNAATGTNAAPAPAVIVGGRAKKRWRELPNGMRVLATDEAYNLLLVRRVIDDKPVIAEPIAQPAPVVAPSAPEPQESVPLPFVPSGPMLGDVPQIERPQERTGLDIEAAASVAAVETIRRKAEEERARLQREMEEEETAIMRALGIVPEAWPSLSVDMDDEEAVIERLIMELLN